MQQKRSLPSKIIDSGPLCYDRKNSATGAHYVDLLEFQGTLVGVVFLVLQAKDSLFSRCLKYQLSQLLWPQVFKLLQTFSLLEPCRDCLQKQAVIMLLSYSSVNLRSMNEIFALYTFDILFGFPVSTLVGNFFPALAINDLSQLLVQLYV